jgi:hypothetical protein
MLLLLLPPPLLLLLLLLLMMLLLLLLLLPACALCHPHLLRRSPASATSRAGVVSEPRPPPEFLFSAVGSCPLGGRPL